MSSQAFLYIFTLIFTAYESLYAYNLDLEKKKTPQKPFNGHKNKHEHYHLFAKANVKPLLLKQYAFNSQDALIKIPQMVLPSRICFH